jgi:hypothetical protein
LIEFLDDCLTAFKGFHKAKDASFSWMVPDFAQPDIEDGWTILCRVMNGKVLLAEEQYVIFERWLDLVTQLKDVFS